MTAIESNIQIPSNLMLVERDGKKVDPRLVVPGDYVTRVYELELGDKYAANLRLTKQQLIERDQYLVCLLCGRPCGGTCELRKTTKSLSINW